MKKILSILIIFLISNSAFAVEYTRYFDFDGHKVLLEEAQSKTQGLMGRESLPDCTGMVFTYSSSVEQGFWMKNMKIPLDIIFLKDGVVTRIYKKVKPCNDEICPVYSSKGLTNQVIELNAGACSKYKIRKGSIVRVKELNL